MSGAVALIQTLWNKREDIYLSNPVTFKIEPYGEKV